MTDRRIDNTKNAMLHAMTCGITYSHLLTTIELSNTGAAYWQEVTKRNSFIIDTPWSSRTYTLFRLTEIAVLVKQSEPLSQVVKLMFREIAKARGVDKECLLYAGFALLAMRQTIDGADSSRREALLLIANSIDTDRKHDYLSGNLCKFTSLVQRLCETGWVTLEDLLDHDSNDFVHQYAKPGFHTVKRLPDMSTEAKNAYEYCLAKMALVAKGNREHTLKNIMYTAMDKDNHDWLSVLAYIGLASEHMTPITSQQLIRVLPSAKILNFLDFYDYEYDVVDIKGDN